MSCVTSKKTVAPLLTAGSVARTGPSIAGRPVFQVMLASLQVQFEIGWMRPPEFEAMVVRSVTLADTSGLVPSPVMLKRMKACFSELGASMVRILAVPNLAFGLAALGEVSAMMAVVVHCESAPGVHTPPGAQMSPVVQALWSSQSWKPVVVPVTAQTPAPSQPFALRVQALPSSQGLPDGSNLQVELQQSPSRVLPSSQSSSASTTPLPQIEAIRPDTSK